MAVTPVSFRSLVPGSGQITPTFSSTKPYRLVFATPQYFHRGETVALASFVPSGGGSAWGAVTIAFGNGTEWVTYQKGTSNVNVTSNWRRTDPSSSRARGGGWTGLHGFIPGAVHFLYMSPFDASGNPDTYSYVDTTYPVNGKHPYTKDVWTGRFWLTNEGVPEGDPVRLVPDTATRIADLDTLPPVLSR